MNYEKESKLGMDEAGIHQGMNESTKIRMAEYEARRKGLRRGIRNTVILSLIILAAAAIVGVSRYNSEEKNHLAAIERQKEAYTELITTRDSVLNQWMQTFDQIERDLNTVKEKQNIITIRSADKEFLINSKEQILKDIGYLNTILDLNKKKIALLTTQLKNSGGSVTGLQTRIAELEASMKLRETEISDLKLALVKKDFEIDTLNARMTEQQLALVQKDEKIAFQTSLITENNKGWVAFGSIKELEESGVVTKKSGFLGLGMKISINSDFSDSTFTQVNVTELKELEVNSKSARFITEHPANSYQMITDAENHIATIEITDPEQFWKLSKYAVVEIKN